jgi:uncharacterized membrane protein YeaQ/YmgE (transglycosylase-associated protein family)
MATMINVLVWLLFGALAGWVASRTVISDRESSTGLNIVAGSLGALIAGVVFLIFDTSPLHVFNVWGLVVALAGAILVIVFVRILLGRPV